MAKIKGTSDDDVQLNGTKGNDTILGRAGVDQLLGRGGNDLLKGGAGVDFLIGATGDDKLLGGNDNDYLDPGGGRDVIDGGRGDMDAVAYVGSKSGVKVKLGKDGATTTGKGGDAKGDQIKNVEIVHGSDQNDKLKGNNLDNFLFGHNGNDLLKAGGGDDTLDGGIGNDSLDGGKGSDALHGNLGDDDLFGGGGADYFYFEAGDFGNDIIWDFEVGVDKISFFDGPDDISEVFGGASQMGSDVLIKYGTSSITLKNIQLSDLRPADFDL